MRPLMSVSALLLSLTLASAWAAEGEKVEVSALPDAVKAVVTKEAPEAKKVTKTVVDGKPVYHVKAKDAEGHPVILTINEDGTVTKAPPKEKKPK
ncbi:MAG TPA: hypothetical protein VHX44_01205 [Planctomycetota bacterium]|nr:hypothetical protein [Planctomycetota bacterium]